ncbi:MAG: glycogen synthase [Clostridia bacterium]|nr:glycogen synthase [Clostridia bacterium]
MAEKKQLKILFASVEVVPYAKTGGLADVAGSLPQTLAAMGNDVRIVMPRYKIIESDMEYVTDFPVELGPRRETCIVRETSLEVPQDKSKKIPVYFIDNYYYYDRDGIYCYFDDADRFALFCRAVLDMLPKIDFKPDVIHCNDWHTGPICMLLNEKYKKYPYYSNISTVFTVHNLEYQGNFSGDVFKVFNLPPNVFTPEKVEFYGMFSFMKAGLVYGDIINTVSETYAGEILTSKYGEKMEGVLKDRVKDLFGITNGISYDKFNPSEDPRIFKNYGADNYLDKKENKTALQKDVGMPVKDVPMFGLISRLTDQKGLNLILDIADQMLKEDIQFVLLGEGDPYYQDAFRNLSRKYPDKVKTFIEFNAALAQRIYAASDIFLMPSRFEPCGLGQIISIRYGTIPIVRATGGLADTIIDYDKDNKNGNGFSFNEFSSKELLKTFERALKLYKKKPQEWSELVKKVLGLDFSWNQPAEKYMMLYGLAMKKNNGKKAPK